MKEVTQKDFDVIKSIMENENFFNQILDLKDAISSIETLVADYSVKLQNAENKNIELEIEELRSKPKWNQLNAEQKQELNGRLDSLIIEDKQGVEGITEIINAKYEIGNALRELNQHMDEYTKNTPKPIPGKTTRTINLSSLPKQIKPAEDLETIIQKLGDLITGLKEDEILELNW